MSLTADNIDIESVFSDLGLDSGESTTLIALLSSGGQTVLQLSKKLKRPRPTIYSQLSTLIEKGLVKKGIIENGSIFYAEKKETILKQFDQRIKGIQTSKAKIKKSLDSIQTDYHHKPRFTVYENSNAIELIFADILRSGCKMQYWFWSVKEMLKVVPENLYLSFHNERIKNGMRMKVLWPEKQKTTLDNHPILKLPEHKDKLREIRLVPKVLEYSASYGVYGTKVAFISASREYYAFVIDSKELSETLTNQFNFTWGLSKKIKT